MKSKVPVCNLLVIFLIILMMFGTLQCGENDSQDSQLQDKTSAMEKDIPNLEELGCVLEVSRKPKVIRRFYPDKPRILDSLDGSGIVVVKALVNKNGYVVDYEILKNIRAYELGSGDTRLLRRVHMAVEDSIAKALKKWQFDVSEDVRAGKNTVSLSIPFNFK